MSPYALATFPGDGDASVVNSDVDETTTVRALDLSKSTFRKLAFDYTVTANTTLQLEFYCDTTGAIQGIGLDTDDAASAASFFQLAGTTTWGNQAYRTSTTGSWVTVTINLSGLAGMNAKYLVFGNSGSDTTECLFRNVKLVETGGATTAVDFDKYFAFDAFKGDELYLVETDSAGNFTKFADHVDFGAAENGVSFGRWPSGSGTLFPMTSNTFGSTNSGPDDRFGRYQRDLLRSDGRETTSNTLNCITTPLRRSAWPTGRSAGRSATISPAARASPPTRPL